MSTPDLKRGKRVVLVHGYNVRDGGKRSIDRMAPTLEELGWIVDRDSADYGWWGLLKIYFKDKRKVEERLVKAFKDADLILTHSNGAAFATRALNKMEPDGRLRVLQHFSPALGRKVPVPEAVTKEYIFHSKLDWIVRLGAMLPFNVWGLAGVYGKTGPGNYTNLDYTNLVTRHSAWLKKGLVHLTAKIADYNYTQVERKYEHTQ